MHIPSSFKETDPATLLQIMQENAFATVVTTDSNGAPVATPLPFLIKHQKNENEENNEITLQAHFARANPQWKQLEQSAHALVIFNGPHCYVSPSWYKYEGVPTWDYVTVHAYGTASLFDNQQTATLIEELSDKYEKSQEYPWEAKSRYDENLLNHIVGFEIKVTVGDTHYISYILATPKTQNQGVVM